jgi:hypothetical protein
MITENDRRKDSMKKLIFVGMGMLVLAGCSSTPSQRNPETEPDKVVARIDNLDERPKYINEAEPFRVENGTVVSTGMTTIPTSDRVEAGYRIAQNSAKGLIAGAVESRLEFIFQNAEEGTSLGATQARYIGAEASTLVTNSIRPGKNYWEKVATTTDSGERITQYKIFSTVNMPESDFKRAILDAIRAAQGKTGLSKNFADKVDAHWNQFVGASAKDVRSTANDREAGKE